MKTEIIKEEKNPFLKRKELTVKITEEPSPTKVALIENLGLNEDEIIVEKITSGFGSQDSMAKILVYDDKESKEKYVVIPKKVRVKMQAEKKAAEEAAAKEAAAKAEEEKKAAAEAEAAKTAAKEEPVAEEPVAEAEPVKDEGVKDEANEEKNTEEAKE